MPTLQARGIDKKLINKVEELIFRGKDQILKGIIDKMRAADVADLIEHLDKDKRLFIIQLLEPEGAGDILVEIEPPVQENILKSLDNESISEIVQELDSDDAADLIGDLPTERAKRIIEAVDDDVSEGLGKLLPYPEDSAGGIMALEFIAIMADATIQDALETIRAKREEVENLYYIWVIDDFERLVGVISIKDLILEPVETKVKQIMNSNIVSAYAYADQEEVIHLAKRYDLVHIPVVDDHNRLVGRITHDDIIDVIEDETDEDISFMAGVLSQEIAEESVFKITKARLPWLIAGLFGGIMAAGIIKKFETSLEQVIAISFFFPVVMAMGGNTGIQAATVVVRGLATGDISLMNIGRRLWMELRVAMINGLICGVFFGIISGCWLNNYRFGAILALTLLLIVIIAGVVGSAIPLALHKLNLDPALGTGPFVTISNDILSLAIYLGMVTSLSHIID